MKYFHPPSRRKLFSLALLVLLPLAVVGLMVSQLGVGQVEATDPTDTSYTLKAVRIKYFPIAANGTNIDIAVTGDVGDPVATIKQHTDTITTNLIDALGKSTSYLRYANPNAQPAIQFQVPLTYEYETAVPMLTDGTRRPNYNLIMQQHNICDLVDNQGFSEVWLFAYQGPPYPGSNYPYLNISESKMSGPFGDISNSGRWNDMPVCNHTYRVYTFNYQRGTGEALHSWGHQVETELKAVDSPLLDRLQGVGAAQALGITGRCGNVHMPPNARYDYDYNNTIPQQSDCLAWNPDAVGATTAISCTSWGCQHISDSDNPQLNYMIWSWQNMPGRLNTKTYMGVPLRNWWDVHGNFDTVMASQKTLFQPESLNVGTYTTITDSFNRADSASTLGQTETGQTWQALRGTWGVNANTAYTTTCAAPGQVVVEGGSANGFIEATLTSNNQDAQLLARVVDSNNLVKFERMGNHYELGQLVNGTYASMSMLPGSTPANNDVIRLVFDNELITVLINGQIRQTLRSTTPAGTKYGLGSWCNTASRFDDFKFGLLGTPPEPDVILTPTHDAHVRSDQPTANFGQLSSLHSDGSPTKIAYIKFNLGSVVAADVANAKLRLYVVDATAGEQVMRFVNNTSWGENVITYDNRPPTDGAGSYQVATMPGGAAGTYVEVNLTDFVKARAGKVTTIAIQQTATDGIDYASAESANTPQLIITPN